MWRLIDRSKLSVYDGEMDKENCSSDSEYPGFSYTLSNSIQWSLLDTFIPFDLKQELKYLVINIQPYSDTVSQQAGLIIKTPGALNLYIYIFRLS